MRFACLLVAASMSASGPGQMTGALLADSGASFFSNPGDEDYAAALKDLEKANIKVNNDPEKHMADLAEALEAVREFPRQLAEDAKGSRLVDLASLNLARALLRADDRAGAAEVMDDLLRRSTSDKLPVQRFGPTLVEFHDARVAELQAAGSAEMQFRCEVSCRVFLDRHTVTSRSGPLYLGSYEVEIEAKDGSLPPERQTIDLDEAGTVLVVRYPMAGVEEEPPPPPPKRIAPRWAEILVTTVGVGAVAAGSALLAIDGRCVGGADPVDANGTICPNLFEASAGGAIALGFGALALGTGVVLLTIDETKIKKAAGGEETDTTAMVHWRMRF